MSNAPLKIDIPKLYNQTAHNQISSSTVEAALNSLVADTMKALVNTQGVHWNVTGPNFHGLHKLTEEQYEEMFEAVDELAERVRALGCTTLQNLTQMAERSSVPDVPAGAAPEAQIGHLVATHEALVDRLNAAARDADAIADRATADLLTRRIAAHQKHIWMVRATLA